MVNNDSTIQEIRLFLDRVLGGDDIPSNQLLLFADLIVAGVTSKLMAKAATGALTYQDMYSQGLKGPTGPHRSRLDLLVRYTGAAFGEVEQALPNF